MKRTFLTAFALLSLFNAAVKAEEVPNPTDDKKVVKHLNLEEVEINASRVNVKLKDLPQKIEVITQRTIEASPAVDVAGLLKDPHRLIFCNIQAYRQRLVCVVLLLRQV